MRTTPEQRDQRLAVLEKLIERKAEYRSHEFELERAILLDLEDCLALGRIAEAEDEPEWHAEVTDFRALVKACAKGEHSLTYLEPNMRTLNGLARSLHGRPPVAGVEVVRRVEGKPRWYEAMREGELSPLCWRYVGEKTVCILGRGHDDGAHEPKGST